MLFPGAELLDFAGPAQAIFEANQCGARYQIAYAGTSPTIVTAQGLPLSGLIPLPAVTPNDWVMIPGYAVAQVRPPAGLQTWVRNAAQAGATICSICTGAFLLGEVGLLDGRRCTTHWRRIGELEQRFPRAQVVHDRLFVRDGPIVTSAGIAAGIDMTLALLESDGGPVLASAVAREMVVYVRRDGSQRQESIYLDYQTHLSPGVHRVQQWLISHPAAKATLRDLGAQADMSPRQLTRVFRKATGLSIQEFRNRLRVEQAGVLMRNPQLTLDAIATSCGFDDARQLRRLYRRYAGMSPSTARRKTGKRDG